MCPITSPPYSAVIPVVDVLHGISISDPYRWLEDQNSAQTREWINEQTIYARSYLDGIAGRALIRERIRELLDVETYDSFLKCRTSYFFRKRLPGQEQPSIYLREGATGEDQLLVDPASRGAGNYAAVKPLRVSPNASLLLYEVKQGGERTSSFEILDVTNRKTLPDVLPHGYLRGFAFTSGSKSFYYVLESTKERYFPRAVFHHVLGTASAADQETFRAGEDDKLRVTIVFGKRQLAFLVQRFLDTAHTDFYLWKMGGNGPAIPVLRDAEHSFAPRFHGGRILAVVNENAPNRKIVDVQPRKGHNPFYFDVIRETDALIRDWAVTANHILVSYARGPRAQILIFDLFGKRLGEIPCRDDETVRILASSLDDDELLLERESFTRPIEILRCGLPYCEITPWARRIMPFDPHDYSHSERSFPSNDGTAIPISIVGRREALSTGIHPVIMTAYGGFAVPASPQFSTLVAFMMERDCLFAVPNIRGGSEFGEDWHSAAKRRNRQVAFDDFLSAAEWLIQTGRTTRAKLAIFGGSNSGLLVGVAITQRPELFQAALCVVPMLDMIRYQHFDNAHVWKEEFGTSDDPEDFRALMNYSPYHAAREKVCYPATLIVSGDADQNCNALHARKMIARLQAANDSDHPILLDYHTLRGHSPVLPLSVRIDALTDRLAFLCDQLHISP